MLYSKYSLQRESSLESREEARVEDSLATLRRRGRPLSTLLPPACHAARHATAHRGAQPRVQVLLVAPRCREPALRPRLAWHPNVFEAARESGPQCWVHATQRAVRGREIA